MNSDESKRLQDRAYRRTMLAMISLSVSIFGPLTAIGQIEIPLPPPHDEASIGLGPSPDYVNAPRVENNAATGIRVKGGEWKRLFGYYNLDRDCKLSKVSVEVEIQPRHGRISTLTQTSHFDSGFKFGMEGMKEQGIVDPRLSCPDGDYDAVVIVYTADEHFMGEDDAVVVFHDHGFAQRDRFSFEVTP